jgi:hypothetical protein
VARGDLEAAEGAARKAAEVSVVIGYLEWAAEAWLVLAEVHRSRDDAEERAAVEEALRLYEQKGNVVGAGWARSFLDETPRTTPQPG